MVSGLAIPTTTLQCTGDSCINSPSTAASSNMKPASSKTGHSMISAALKTMKRGMLCCIKLKLSLLPAEEEGFL